MDITFNSWNEVVTASFQNLWLRFTQFLPNLLVAIIIFVAGWIIAVFLGKLTARIVKACKIDGAMERLKFKKALEEAGVKYDISRIVGSLVKWFLILVFLMAAVDILKLRQIADFLNSVVGYIPNVIVAVVILLAGILLADFISNLIKAGIKAAKFASAEILAALAKWAILIFSLVIALVHLGVAKEIIHTLFGGLVAMLAIAGGLAFGLGGKDKAREILDKIKEDISTKE